MAGMPNEVPLFFRVIVAVGGSAIAVQYFY
jgi:hypothetical protein